MFVFFHRMPRRHAGSRKGWYARRRKSVIKGMKQMQLQDKTPLPTTQQVQQLIQHANHIANTTDHPQTSLMFLVVGLACSIAVTPVPGARGNVFLSWAQSYAEFYNSSDCWVCSAMPLSVGSLPWWVAPLQTKDFSAVCDFLRQQKEIYSMLKSQNVSALAWCSQSDCNSEVIFDVNVTNMEAMDIYLHELNFTKKNGKGGCNRTVRFQDKFYQIWDQFMWMTPETGQLINSADICWEQKEQRCGYNHMNLSNKDWRYMGKIAPRLCKQIVDVTFDCNKPFSWPGSDWNNPGLRWSAPNGTRWLCGKNVWPWLPVGWVGRCTLGFVMAPGRIVKTVDSVPANLPNLHARWGRSVFDWYDYLASIFIPPLGNIDIMTKVDALTNFTQKALLDVRWAIEDLNEEQKQMRKAVIQNRMALDITTAAQGGTCAIIKVECCVFIPDLSENVSRAVEDIQRQVKAMDHPKSPLF
uniref:Endogenous retrovirus group PABLB member 1 Env polyprotein-like n=1 Tax=Camelus bactrianus TaxID=9837 RepID=A0A9W3GSV0_CAMBA|nr:endogenous retrovirus group PABLB member 1 Env polyprotein-like [Camelus bactrianus]